MSKQSILRRFSEMLPVLELFVVVFSAVRDLVSHVGTIVKLEILKIWRSILNFEARLGPFETGLLYIF